ncbi:3-hydroxyacyl-CoA dehydrogenase-like protein LAM1 [Cladobotryum mycophilum]|uniref:3-hydroxyacyl-CoA dehydrogenase-like protein LAM1 n=1 Tax=Cladobotryum mycophilum TaxID=491253 RepID=A0ABR0SIM6_9HYPO
MSIFTLPPTEGRTVAVLGGGVLGRRIACAWAAGGFDVTIRDPSQEQRIAAVHYCDTSMSQYSDNEKRGKVEAFADLQSAVEKAWLVIEAVPEYLPLKISTFEDLEKLTTADTILVTNSSSYKSREMVQTLKKETQQRILNMHYYMPPGNRIVELMTDGETHENIFPFLVEKLKAVDMHPYVARKESTGLIFNRLWAAIKREILYILDEGVADPEEIDELWEEMWSDKSSGPVAKMDAVGLDTVSFIEQHYIAERHLPDTPIAFLKKYIDAGKLGAKSGKGGLLPPGATTKVADETRKDHDDIHAPFSKNPQDATHSGRVLVGSPDGRPLKTLVEEQHAPDGLDISLKTGKLFWTCMGIPSANDGAVYSSSLDGTEVMAIVPEGKVHTPKQLTIDHVRSKLYFSDREGLRVMRCNFDGSELEVVIQSGDWQNSEEQAEQTRWCVGVSLSQTTGKFYWTQKGPSKGFKGRIFQANIDFLPGENAGNRTDVECIFQNLPEPIDLEFDETHKTLYWTDRGELPLGNSINRASLEDVKAVTEADVKSLAGQDYELIARNLHEAIGIRLDLKNHHFYATDLGGAVYRFDLDGSNKKKFYEDEGAFVGITLAYV